MNRLSRLFATLELLNDRVQRVCDHIEHAGVASPIALSVKQAAELLGREPFTVREWCRTGRIKCYRATARGLYAEYRIPIESIRHYQAHGLLPSPKYRPEAH